jgi:hypothetical protein
MRCKPKGLQQIDWCDAGSTHDDSSISNEDPISINRCGWHENRRAMLPPNGNGVCQYGWALMEEDKMDSHEGRRPNGASLDSGSYKDETTYKARLLPRAVWKLHSRQR